jgi:hypothetical protein
MSYVGIKKLNETSFIKEAKLQHTKIIRGTSALRNEPADNILCE